MRLLGGVISEPVDPAEGEGARLFFFSTLELRLALLEPALRLTLLEAEPPPDAEVVLRRGILLAASGLATPESHACSFVKPAGDAAVAVPPLELVVPAGDAVGGGGEEAAWEKREARLEDAEGRRSLDGAGVFRLDELPTAGESTAPEAEEPCDNDGTELATAAVSTDAEAATVV